MSTRLTLFTATLIQDSALSVSGLDRRSNIDQPFDLVDNVPTLVGRGIKGAAVAMAKRFFDPLPRYISDSIQHGTLRRSAWEFSDATAQGAPRVRAGVGIRQKTGARATGVLYDHEVIPAGTKWKLNFRVDRSQVLDDAEFTEAEGILGYVLSKHWAQGRCWLGGGVSRGLGWCHLHELKAYRFNETTYDQWVEAGRPLQPDVDPTEIPTVAPTRSWHFRTLDVDISFGEYSPDGGQPAWGLDMLAIGAHDTERVVQATGDGAWAKPAWVKETNTPQVLYTDRAMLMDGSRPLLPGASVRGPLRHTFSRTARMKGHTVQDPHTVQGDVGDDDPAGKAFGTVNQSSRILIRDARAEQGWAAAKMHMHAEDEFSAGSYGSSKRDAVHLLRGNFPVRIVVEGATPEEVAPLVDLIDQQVALGTLTHLPIGGHKAHGAGAGHWKPKNWVHEDVIKARDRVPAQEASTTTPTEHDRQRHLMEPPKDERTWLHTSTGTLENTTTTLGDTARIARAVLGENALVAWWCDPTIDLQLNTPPATFGRTWPEDTDDLRVDEVAFFTETSVWRAARTVEGMRFVSIKESTTEEANTQPVQATHTPAFLHDFKRFSAASTGQAALLLREWHTGKERIGFTISKIGNP